MPSLDHFNRIKCLICAKCCFGLFPRDGGGKGGVGVEATSNGHLYGHLLFKDAGCVCVGVHWNLR